MGHKTIQKHSTYPSATENRMEWVRCPVCGNKTRVKVRNDTVLLNFPLHCPKCKNVNLIEMKNSKIVSIK